MWSMSSQTITYYNHLNTNNVVLTTDHKNAQLRESILQQSQAMTLEVCSFELHLFKRLSITIHYTLCCAHSLLFIVGLDIAMSDVVCDTLIQE